jgi:hypothetical protein
MKQVFGITTKHLLAGDSLGVVYFWNLETFEFEKSFRTKHGGKPY